MQPFLSFRVWMGWGLYALQLALALLFIFSAVAKFFHLMTFYLSVRGMSPVSTEFLLQLNVYFLPSLEFVLAGVLVVRRCELAALGLLFLLVLFYIYVLARAYILGLNVPYDCFEVSASYAYGILRNIILVSLLGWLFWVRWGESR